MTPFSPGTRVTLARDFLASFGTYVGALEMVRGRVIRTEQIHRTEASSTALEKIALVAWDGSEAEPVWLLSSQLAPVEPSK